mmetsp:Transcript_12404/g.33468  ORF Transcript_12404/g.33468 Transcript_12404/m.33468 type:complete len:287 (-) Transcript_12404:119-979(-)
MVERKRWSVADDVAVERWVMCTRPQERTTRAMEALGRTLEVERGAEEVRERVGAVVRAMRANDAALKAEAEERGASWNAAAWWLESAIEERDEDFVCADSAWNEAHRDGSRPAKISSTALPLDNSRPSLVGIKRDIRQATKIDDPCVVDSADSGLSAAMRASQNRNYPRSTWSREEEIQLMKCIMAHKAEGKSVGWAAGKALIPGRTSNACHRKYYEMMKRPEYCALEAANKPDGFASAAGRSPSSTAEESALKTKEPVSKAPTQMPAANKSTNAAKRVALGKRAS